MKTYLNILDCGGKRSATPLLHREGNSIFLHLTICESGVAAALCHRSPKFLKLI